MAPVGNARVVTIRVVSSPPSPPTKSACLMHRLKAPSSFAATLHYTRVHVGIACTIPQSILRLSMPHCRMLREKTRNRAQESDTSSNADVHPLDSSQNNGFTDTPTGDFVVDDSAGSQAVNDILLDSSMDSSMDIPIDSPADTTPNTLQDTHPAHRRTDSLTHTPTCASTQRRIPRSTRQGTRHRLCRIDRSIMVWVHAFRRTLMRPQLLPCSTKPRPVLQRERQS